MVFAFAMDLGSISTTAQPIVWSIGVVRNPAIAFTNAAGAIKNRAPLFMAKYPGVPHVVSPSALLVQTNVNFD